MEIVTLALFCLALLVCVVFDVSVLYALGVGLAVFGAYAKLKNHSFKSIIGMIFNGIKTSKNILINFLLIGLLTASWRFGGTIAFIISSASELISPQIFVLMTFVLNAFVSFLMGVLRYVGNDGRHLYDDGEINGSQPRYRRRRNAFGRTLG